MHKEKQLSCVFRDGPKRGAGSCSCEMHESPNCARGSNTGQEEKGQSDARARWCSRMQEEEASTLEQRRGWGGVVYNKNREKHW